MKNLKKLTESEFQELKLKRDWCIFIAEYNKSLVSAEEKKWCDWEMQIIDDAFKNNNLQGMRVAYCDTNEMAKGLSRSQIEELNAILREKFGEDLTTVNKRIAARIQKIEERGYIKTEGEWRMARDWIDHIMWDDSKDKEVELLEKLMSEYDKSIEKKRAARKLKNRNSTKK